MSTPTRSSGQASQSHGQACTSFVFSDTIGENMAKKNKNIVVIGGGTGTSVVLEGLKKYPVNLSAIITTADDGSSSGKVRSDYELIPPGDIRQCLVALASKDFGFLNKRFSQGFLQGHTLGNILMTIFYQENKDFQQSLDDLLRVTGAQGSLMPMTLQPTTLVARLKDGRTLTGEKNITQSREIAENLRRLHLHPHNAKDKLSTKANPRAIKAIKGADVIVVGPGNLFSSILPNFLVPGIRNAFVSSKAKKIYISNLFTQPGHTDNFTPADFIKVISQYMRKDAFTHVIYNSRPINETIVARYKNSFVGPPVQVTKEIRQDKRFVGRVVAKASPQKASSADPMAKIRNPFLHDSSKLARAIMNLL